MDFLASPEALELEDQIEEVNARHLEKLVKERPFVAVFFCKMFAYKNSKKTKVAECYMLY
jgi:hypothetical protein